MCQYFILKKHILIKIDKLLADMTNKPKNGARGICDVGLRQLTARSDALIIVFFVPSRVF